MSGQHNIPEAFVWTKMQAEAGQPLEVILRRKELERQAGNGEFWWGIGESKGAAIDLLRCRTPAPEVLFSRTRGAPRQIDLSPSGVVIWETYRTASGEHPVPPHVIVAAKAMRGTQPRATHYALVCRSKSPLIGSGGGQLDAGALQNIGRGGKPVGSSQVTAVVERGAPSGRSMNYPIASRAILEKPCSATLSSPRELSPTERRLLYEVGMDGETVDDWLAVVRQLRRR